MKVALAQLNVTVGDLPGNADRILRAYERGVTSRVDLILCPELCVTGYPPRDLLLKKRFVAQTMEALNRLAAAT
jgi:NAD+ synthase (glutamine-hydrolysing)